MTLSNFFPSLLINRKEQKAIPQKKKYVRLFQDCRLNNEEFKNWLVKNKNIPEKKRYKICNAKVYKHANTGQHKNNLKRLKMNLSIEKHIEKDNHDSTSKIAKKEETVL